MATIRQILIWPLLVVIWLYKKSISPILPKTCRYYPSCSTYSQESLKVHGLIKGLVLSSWRIFRCNPFSKGGIDEVPPENLSLYKSLKYYKESE